MLKKSLREAKPHLYIDFPFPAHFGGEFKRGEAPLKKSSPSPFKERGIKGVRFIENQRPLVYPDLKGKNERIWLNLL